MVVLTCKQCNNICNTVHFQLNFGNWTSGNNDINRFIRDTQLFFHETNQISYVLEWIPFDRFYDIKHIIAKGEVYIANWIDGYMNKWNNENQNWERKNQNMFVILKNLNNLEILKLEYIGTFEPHRVYGVTQNPVTKDYMMIQKDICEKCSYICNAVYFQRNFKIWTSGNNNVDKFIQNTQLLAHNDAEKALEWIPYDKVRGIKCIVKDEIYKANWIDGYINKWDDENQKWKRKNHDMIVILRRFNSPENNLLKFINEIAKYHRVYGITQDPKTKHYMVIFSKMCKKHNDMCNALYFQQNFKNWTSGNNDIDEFIQITQLLSHNTYQISKALEWIPYDRFYNIKCTAKVCGDLHPQNFTDKLYRANWIDGYINKWDDANQNWKRKNQDMIIILKIFNSPENVLLKFISEFIGFHEVYGITKDPETKNFIVAFNEECKKYKHVCNALHFQQNFKNWTSGNSDIDGFVQYIQLSSHSYNACHALEWIPYNKFYDIEYIAKGGFGKVYKANWKDGCIDKWDDENQNWRRKNQNMLVALKSLNNSKNVTLEFMNEITSHCKVNLGRCIVKLYGITQDPETENYAMVLDFAEDGDLRNYLNKNHNKLYLNDKINYLHSITRGLADIHKNELIHRDLHIGNILRFKDLTCITDMGLCKPADYNPSENTKNSTYGILPYIAPEILRGQNYTKASDIYSFGIIMYEVISELPPYHDQ
ncbi:Ypk2p [Rhizophagus irregularis DAOM 197198w]|uniref:Ypk2p n=1 Tax=Rhizophagus irregularis (strain DAOM 197198w) TaxID=1432141 RepID=A0A015MZ61_RHIIW|nr:Ypk2p [Rhizophagus irregularis DAOM 197198w]